MVHHLFSMLLILTLSISFLMLPSAARCSLWGSFFFSANVHLFEFHYSLLCPVVDISLYFFPYLMATSSSQVVYSSLFLN